MPRLTSFDGNENQQALPGNEWQIVAKQSFILTRYYAQRGDRTVEVGLITSNKQRSIRAKPSLTGPYRHEVKLTLDGVSTVFSMIMNDKGCYSFEPKIGTVQKAGARTLFVINGLAKGTYRTAWKDSDTAKNIIGFINIECENPSNEEEFVWLFGSIGRHGLDQFVPQSD